MSDDTFHDFQCNGFSFGSNSFNNFSIDQGNILLGVSRMLSFGIIVFFNRYNKFLLKKKLKKDNIKIIKGLVLPSYFGYIYLYIFLSLFTGFLDIVINEVTQNSAQINATLLPLEFGLAHWLYEGLAFFLMRYGAGVGAIFRSLSYSLVWGIFTCIFYIIIFGIIRENYGLKRDITAAFILYILYQTILVAFYGTFVFTPLNYLYRRPAMDFYAKCNFIFYLLCIFFISLVYGGIHELGCPFDIIIFILISIAQPIVIFRTLQIDSEYWQGLTADQSNPLTEVWDHLDLDTARSMAEYIEDIDRKSTSLPIYHFGLIQFDTSIDFVSGGFSRVYFGKLKDEKVAFKVLFAMELTPDDVKEFYIEANVLYKLQHENVVECKGICVMPPSLTLILESCKYGSLFDFLYKPRKIDKSLFDQLTMAVQDSQKSGWFRSSLFHQLESKMTPEDMLVNMNPMLSPNAGDRSSALQSKQGIKRNSGPQRLSRPTSRREQAPMSPESIEMNVFPPPVKKNDKKNLTLRETSDSGYVEEESSMSKISDVQPSDHASSLRPSASAMSEESDFSGRGNSFAPRRSLAAATIKSLSNMMFYKKDSMPSSYNLNHPLALYLSYKIRLQMARDAMSGIAFLHSKNFMHCDIKSLNFLVTEDFRVKLADMGEARHLSMPPKRDIPPIPARNWAPPEVLYPKAKPESYTMKSDIFGLCIVLSEILTLELPYGDLPDRVPPAKWLHILTVEKLRPNLPDILPMELANIIESGWANDPNARPNADEILTTIDRVIDSENLLYIHEV